MSQNKPQMLVVTKQVPIHCLTHCDTSASPTLLPANPGQNMGVSTAIKTYRRYNNNNGDNSSTSLCYEY